MKVLMGFDDCGHAFAFDISTTEQEYSILEGMCKEAAKKGRFTPEEKTKVKDALSKREFDKVYEILDRADLLHPNQRGCVSTVEVQTSWKTGLGVMNI